MGLFGPSKYQKYKPIYNEWLHFRKSGLNQGMSLAEAESYAYDMMNDRYKSGELSKAVSMGQREGWGAARLTTDLDLP